MRRVGRDDDHISRAKLAADSAFDRAATRARTVEHFDHLAIGWRLLGVHNRTSSDKGAVAFDHVIDLGDLAVLDAIAIARRRGPGAMNHADSNVVFVVDADHADRLIAHGSLRSLLKSGLDFGFRY